MTEHASPGGDERGDPVERVLEAARAAGLGATGPPVVAMVSGGRDSVCLLDAAVTLCGAERVRALHVNYGLRPEADAEQEHVEGLCRDLGVSLEVFPAARPEGATGNLQAWARDTRYGAATRLALAHDALVLAGHTASDQVETVLYRLAASPGRRALLGMAARDGRLLRPLLGVWRSETAAYCRARGLAWCEDPSNETSEYARGRVRHGLTAALRDVHPSAEANVLRTAALLRDEAAVLDAVVDTALAGRDRIAASGLGELPAALARLVVVRMAEDAGGQPLPAAGGRVEELLALGAAGGTAELDLGGGVRAVVEYGVLRMAAGPKEPVPDPVTLPVPGRVRFGTWEVACELDSPAANGLAPGDELVDADALGDSLTVRAWRTGDRMRPHGLGGSKTLADLFTDRHLPRAGRRTIPVVERAGAIAWVPGIALGEGYPVSDRTRRTAWLSARRG